MHYNKWCTFFICKLINTIILHIIYLLFKINTKSRKKHLALSLPISGVMKRGGVKSEFTMSIQSMATLCVHTGLTTTSHWWHQMVQKPLWDVVPDLNKVTTQLVQGHGWFGRRRRRLSISSYWCSVGDRSGKTAGQGSVLTFCCPRKSVTTRATWGRALSCCNMKTPCWPWRNGSTCGLMIS